MSDVAAQYIATLLQSVRVLLCFFCVGSLWYSWRLFSRSHALSTHQQGSEEVRHLVDWTASSKVRKRAFIFLILTPIAFLGWRLTPSYYPALGMLSDSRACMANGESGELIDGYVSHDEANIIIGAPPPQFTFKMDDGSAIVCRLDDINVSRAVEGQRYRITHGVRIS